MEVTSTALLISFMFVCSAVALPLSIISIIMVIGLKNSTHSIQWKDVPQELSDKELNETLHKELQQELNAPPDPEMDLERNYG